MYRNKFPKKLPKITHLPPRSLLTEDGTFSPQSLRPIPLPQTSQPIVYLKRTSVPLEMFCNETNLPYSKICEIFSLYHLKIAIYLELKGPKTLIPYSLFTGRLTKDNRKSFGKPKIVFYAYFRTKFSKYRPKHSNTATKAPILGLQVRKFANDPIS